MSFLLIEKSIEFLSNFKLISNNPSSTVLLENNIKSLRKQVSEYINAISKGENKDK